MNRWIGVWVLLATVLAGGCGMTAQERATIGAFAQATRTLGETSSGAFVMMREDTIALSGAVLELGNPVSAPITPEDLDRALDPEDVAARVLAMRALTEYGTLLEALASGTIDERARRAALGLAGSFETLDERGVVALDEGKREALTGILAGIASGAVEAHAAGAVREVVPATAPVIERLSDLLIAEFDEGGAGFASQVLVARSDAIAAARVVESSLESLADDPASAPLRGRLASIYERASEAGARVGSSGALVREAATALRDANEALRISSEADGALAIDGLESLVIRVHELVGMVEVLADD